MWHGRIKVSHGKIAFSLAMLALVVITTFWFWPGLRCKVLGQASSCFCGSCCNTGPVAGRTVRDVYSCYPNSFGSCTEQWVDVSYSCDGPDCSYTWDQGKCNTYAKGCLPLLPNEQTVYCCSERPKTPDHTSMPGTPVPIKPPTPRPVRVNLYAQYGALLLYGPRLEQPAQFLYGEVEEGLPPYEVIVSVKRPSGAIQDYLLGNNAPKLNAANTGDAFFGVDEEGTWTAWAKVDDAYGQHATSLPITWTVAWYPTHGRR